MGSGPAHAGLKENFPAPIWPESTMEFERTCAFPRGSGEMVPVLFRLVKGGKRIPTTNARGSMCLICHVFGVCAFTGSRV